VLTQPNFTFDQPRRACAVAVARVSAPVVLHCHYTDAQLLTLLALFR
jgi:hypothetical protein